MKTLVEKYQSANKGTENILAVCTPRLLKAVENAEKLKLSYLLLIKAGKIIWKLQVRLVNKQSEIETRTRHSPIREQHTYIKSVAFRSVRSHGPPVMTELTCVSLDGAKQSKSNRKY